MDIFANQVPDEAGVASIERIRAAARTFAEVIETEAPPCADRSAAVRKVREAMMTANAAVALKGYGDVRQAQDALAEVRPPASGMMQNMA